MPIQILEPPTTVNLSYDPELKAYYAEGFLFSTKKTLPAPEGAFRISQETGHEIAKTALQKNFMIDANLLEAQDDGHFYGFGRDALLKGYANKSHGVIEQVKGPFYYNDGTKDYWYNFRMRLRNSGAAAALIRYGEKAWTPYSVSPHFWDFPELNQDPENLKKAEIVGVALVMKGAYGDQAVITRLCKGDGQACYGSKGFGASLEKKCSADCSCDICVTEDNRLVQLITSHIGKSAFQETNTLEPNNPNANLEGGKPNNPSPATNATVSSQTSITEAPKSQPTQEELLKAEVAKLKADIEAEAEKKWKGEVDTLKNDAKQNTLEKIFPADLVTDENTRKTLYDKYMKRDLSEVRGLKDALDDINAYVIPGLKAKWKAELEKPSGDSGENKPTEASSGDTDASNKKGKGKGASESKKDLPSEPTHPLPKDENASASNEQGKSASNKPNEIQRFRNLLGGF